MKYAAVHISKLGYHYRSQNADVFIIGSKLTIPAQSSLMNANLMINNLWKIDDKACTCKISQGELQIYFQKHFSTKYLIYFGLKYITRIA